MNKTSVGIRRLQILNSKDSLPHKNKILTDEQLVDLFSQEMELSGMAIHILGVLHNEIAKIYLRIIDEWVAIYTAASIGLVDSKETRPANYTPEMTRLRNLSWNGYTPDFGGFCIKEPLVRILQLAKYPIDQFGGVHAPSDEIKFPPRPIVPTSDPSTVTMDRISSLLPHFIAREQWLLEICKIVDKIVKLLVP